MAEMAQIKSSPQNLRAWGLIISVLNRQKNEIWLVGGHQRGLQNLKRVFGFFNNLVKLFTVQNRLKLGPQLPTHPLILLI